MREEQREPIEDALGSLRPRPSSIDRDGLMFEAGRRSARQGLLWPSAAAVATLAAAGLAAALFLHPRPVVREVRYVQRTAPVMEAEADAIPPGQMPLGQASIVAPRELGEMSYGRLRWLVLTEGVSALPSPVATQGEPLEPGELLGHPSVAPAGTNSERGG
ncbi:MAG: hypothetical protein ACYTFZ_02280, partial [Planctomycetota bacterium]